MPSEPLSLRAVDRPPPPEPPDRRVAPTLPTTEQSERKTPRLVLRFAVYTAVGLALAAAGIIVFVRHSSTTQAEATVTSHAEFVASSLLRERLRASDLVTPVGDARRAELDQLFARQVLVDGTLSVTLYAPDGTITYASDHSLIGSRAPDAGAVRTAVDGEATGHPSSLETVSGSEVKTFAAYAPVYLNGAASLGAFSLQKEYRPIAAAARKAFLPVAGVLELLLFGLYFSLFPVLHRVTKRMRRQMLEIEYQALHDGLTDLPNRALFRERVEQAIRVAKRDGGGFAVLLFDLDRFKEVNDTLGHESGDRLLKALAERLRTVVRESDTVARLGGDEFGILLPGAADEHAALSLAERMRQELERPLLVGGFALEVEASIGIAVYPEHGDDVETLIRHADVAMYVSKDAHSPKLYAAHQDTYSPERIALVGELRRAIKNSELVLYYQPQADLSSGEVHAVEALVRWQHPELGLLAPDQFIPLVERTALVRPLTRYILDAAMRQSRAWRDEGIEVTVAVNLFGRDLADVGLPDEVEELLARWKIPADGLELEIAENTILTEPERARTILERLGENGVTLAIDDFGSGYTSFHYLKRLPVDVLKIDRSFVQAMTANGRDAIIVRSTVELGQNLGLVVVAEGVETQEIWDRLTDYGCDRAQGYFLSRPVPASELTTWLRAQPLPSDAGDDLLGPRAAAFGA